MYCGRGQVVKYYAIPCGVFRSAPERIEEFCALGLRPAAMVLISKANMRLVYENLFNEGVRTVKHDPSMPKHGKVDVLSLHAMMLLSP